MQWRGLGQCMKKEKKARKVIYVDQDFLDSLDRHVISFREKPLDILKRILKEYEKLKKEKEENPKG